MRVIVKYISVIASITGAEEETIELVEGSNVADLVSLLCNLHCSRFSKIIYLHSQNRKYLVRFIVNNKAVQDTYRLNDGDTLNIILALGGG